MEWTPFIDCAYDVDFTIAVPGATMVCTIQLQDFEGKSLNVKNAVYIYFTTDADGDTQATVTSAVLATHGIIHQVVSNKAYLIITEDDGIAAFTINNSSAADLYVNVILHNGKVVTSPVMAFNA